ncbi:MAG: hypothetical protein PHW04_09150 [Candidatus Wallbacteria bacterium]|nr:hypothetical protein [Candidatus Wallbacteria bacterium]
MGNTTIRLPDDKLRMLRAISGYENRPMSRIVEELLDDYLERHKETQEIISCKTSMESIRRGLEDEKSGKMASLKKAKKILHVED